LENSLQGIPPTKFARKLWNVRSRFDSGLLANHDFHVAIERVAEMHEPFHGKPFHHEQDPPREAGRTNASAPTWVVVVYNHLLPVFNFLLG
jgi:hypothetical protein